MSATDGRTDGRMNSVHRACVRTLPRAVTIIIDVAFIPFRLASSRLALCSSGRMLRRSRCCEMARTQERRIGGTDARIRTDCALCVQRCQPRRSIYNRLGPRRPATTGKNVSRCRVATDVRDKASLVLSTASEVSPKAIDQETDDNFSMVWVPCATFFLQKMFRRSSAADGKQIATQSVTA